ncbi:nucleotidyl transferase AbiEii/AbiGii toxin family protein [Mesorhizobium sp. BR115XR7A]|uniref:nucleotidyl transferase AbiEii/AbiGii toxin family protein n=1 Tax=Mesorhizobium sp. BR115XR7A TaxID=2876645 RepID=UPI001CC96213|nr:nucleotidyl transferase AbiEii/AbiGii toxin family protein [Mesorhizobium sp. BR115XR7A]MBZ9905272.1 nucleotidyl transferase AbiEii/AbiGii toxin family protein [Mesorhizobium sp. BR115XR7A]MBZ9931053.1 nucleotidyl transferase AbiEii/AbiGii toxin family protein [Mesorhizobium sp. BR1-1-5]
MSTASTDGVGGSLYPDRPSSPRLWLCVHPREFDVENPWFTGKTNVPTFSREEMLATQLRALLQRDKGRDLYDLAHALGTFGWMPACYRALRLIPWVVWPGAFSGSGRGAYARQTRKPALSDRHETTGSCRTGRAFDRRLDQDLIPRRVYQIYRVDTRGCLGSHGRDEVSFRSLRAALGHDSRAASHGTLS